MVDPRNRAYQAHFLSLLQAKDLVSQRKLMGWFADAAHYLGCLEGGIQALEQEPELPTAPVDMSDLEDKIRQLRPAE